MDRKLVWDLSQKCGGHFKFTVLMQKRIRELVAGAPKLCDIPSNSPIDIALKEIELGLIELDFMSPAEIEELQRSIEEQAAAQSLLDVETGRGAPGEPSAAAISEFLKSS
jgi:DNA-directed RNA polymerase subunit K/omega